MGYKVVVAGATGNVGREMLNILAEREFPADEVVALASRRSLGTEVSYGDKTLTTKDIEGFDFTGYDIALFAIGSDATKKYAPIAAEQGCVVIDNSSLYRYDPAIPLVVPEVNPDAVENYRNKMPISVSATCRCQGACAVAKTAAPPAPPSASSTATVRRGPIRSSAAPMGSCMAAKAKNHSPDEIARSSGAAPSSACRTGDSTARKAR